MHNWSFARWAGATQGDTLSLRHILVRIQQSDSSATRTDRLADSLAKLAAASDKASKFDSAAKRLHLTAMRGMAIEGEPLMMNGTVVPSVSAWAFGGAKPGESSDLFDSDQAYYLARLDSLSHGGEQSLDDVKASIREKLLLEKKLDKLVSDGQALAQAAASSTLEDAAKAKGLTVVQSPLFNRMAFVPGLGRMTAVIGAAFALPSGAISAPVKGEDHVYVLRVDKKIDASRDEWAKQKATQRQQMLQGLRQQRVRSYLASLRRQAKVDDNRKQFMAQARRES